MIVTIHYPRKFSCSFPISSQFTRGNHLSEFTLLQIILHFQELHMNRVIQYVLIYVWLLSLNIMSLIFIHAVVPVHAFLFIDNCIMLHGYNGLYNHYLDWYWGFYLIFKASITILVKISL